MVRVKSVPRRQPGIIKRKTFPRRLFKGRSHITKWRQKQAIQHKTKVSVVPNKAFKSGVVALRIIKRFHKRTDMLLPKITFQRLVRDIALQSGHVRFQTIAMMALQEATENFLVNLFEDSLQCALHTRRVTLMVQDMQLVHRIRARNVASQ